MEELIRRLIELVETASPKLWEIAMRQVVINNICNVAGYLLLIFACYAWVKWGHKKMMALKDGDDFDAEMLGEIGLWVGWAILGFMILFMIANLSILLTGFLNPQYAALDVLLHLVK